MTIGIGLKAEGGIVLAADSQETIAGFAKRHTGKIPIFVYKNFAVTFVGAGHSDYIETAIQKATNNLSRCKNLREVEMYLEERLVGFFDGHLANWAMFPVKERPDLELLVGITMKNGPSELFHYTGTVFQRTAHKAIGMGAILATGLVSDLCWDIQDLTHLTTLAVYIIKRMKDSVNFCGGFTSLVAMRSGGDFGMSDSREIRKLEDALSEIEEHNKKDFRAKMIERQMPIRWLERKGKKELGWG